MSKVEEILTDSVKSVIKKSSDKNKIAKLKKTHSVKLHFIPYKYRIFGGILQSMNIQFGNFIENVMEEVIADNPNNEIITQYSGKKDHKFKLSKNSDALIDRYITDCQINNYTETELLENYDNLLKEIRDYETDENNEYATFKHDVDLLFKTKDTGDYYYVEIKYNDDHDTDKFVGINRKLLKTYAYLTRELGGDVNLHPLLFYFNNKKMKGNIYLPENEAIYRGKRFFDEFATVGYDSLDVFMKNISESADTIEAFDNLYDKIVKS